MKRVSAAAALAALTASALLPPAANAVVGTVRATGDYRLTPTPNNDPSRGKSGPNLAVNPTNPNHVVEMHQELETEECEYNVSFDGGTTWNGGGELQAPTTGSPAYPVDLPGPCDVTGHGAANIGQHSTSFGSGNNVYIVWTSTRQLNVQGFGVLLSKSTNGGLSYTTTEVSPGGVAPAPNYSRPEIVVDRRGTTTDRLFVSVRNDRTSKAMVIRSDDAGATWNAPVEASNNNPISNPAPVWNAEGTAITQAGDAFVRPRELTGLALAPVPAGPASGYRLVGADGSVYTFGNAGNFGDLRGIPLTRPIVGSATTASGNGYWMVASDGGIFTFGDAGFFGSTGGIPLARPIVGMAPTPSGNGYWLVASDGGIFTFGDAGFFGSTGGIPLTQPIVGMSPTPSGNGYWLVASDGGIFAFGDAGFFGSTGGIPLDRPIVGMTPTASGNGYWLVASDGGIFTFGDAGFFGSTGGIPLDAPIVGMRVSPTGQGYNLVAADGGIFSFGDAGFFGSTGGQRIPAPVVGMAPSNKVPIRPLYLGWVAEKISGTCPPACETLGQNSTDNYIVVAKSLDNGQTWTRSRAINTRGFTTPAGVLNSGSQFPRIAAGNNGEVYVTFNQGPGVPGSNDCGSGPFPLGTPGASGSRTCPSYGLTPFKQADHFMSWDMDVFFMRSTDQGQTFTNLRQLNEGKKPGLVAPEVTQTRHPEMVVAPDGRVDIAWEDRRHWYLGPSDRKNAIVLNTSVNANPGNLGNYGCVHSHSNCPEARLGDTYYSHSTDGGVTFSFNRRINDRSHNNDVGYDYRFSAYWDYGPALAALGNERLLVADMDARFGNPDNESMDIVLRKVELNAPSTITTAPIQTTLGPVAASAAVDFSVALSRHTYPGGAEAVHGEGFTNRPWTRPVIVNEADYPSVLAAGVLARANLGPVLVSPTAGLPANVQAEVSRLMGLSPVGAYIVGDATKLAPTVEAQLVAAGVPAAQIVRIAGSTPAEIAANIALNLDRRRAPDKTTSPPLPAFDAVIIANPNSASAASASALAANRRLPILYVDQNAVPAATTSAIAALNVNRAIIVGSTGVVSAGVATTLSTAAPAGSGLTVTRLSGDDQFATSSAVVTESIARGLPRNIVYVADGNEPMHAALLGPAVGRVGGLLVMTTGGSAAIAGSTLSNPPHNLGPYIDQIRTSDLTGTAVVANDPGPTP